MEWWGGGMISGSKCLMTGRAAAQRNQCSFRLVLTAQLTDLAPEKRLIEEKNFP